MTPLMLLVGLGLALAGTAEDLARAADAELDEAARMQAFHKMVLDFPTARPVLEQVAKDAEGDARQRWVAIRVMGQTRSRDALGPLITLCADPMPAIRAAAAAALGDLGYFEASDTLGGLLRDPAIMVRAEAATALGRLGDARSAPALERALSDRSNFYRGTSLWVRPLYVEALGEIGAWTSVPVLIACLDDKDPAVVAAALAALRQIVGYDFSEGRTSEEHIEAWRRWAGNQKF